MQQRRLDGLRVAILVADDFEQSEMTEPRQALETIGAKTTLISVHVTDRCSRAWDARATATNRAKWHATCAREVHGLDPCLIKPNLAEAERLVVRPLPDLPSAVQVVQEI